MRLPRLPFLRSTANASRLPRAVPTSADEPAGVEAARTRARRRLGGALVLLAAGVVGFPVVFETQPRPLPVDTPITVAAGGAPAVSAPATSGAARVTPLPPEAPPAASSVTTRAAPPVAPTALPTATVAVTTPSSAAGVDAPAEEILPPLPRVPSPPVAEAVPSAAPGPLPASAAAPAPAAAASAGARFIVQVGAYADPATLREARSKVERLGLKTYTQVVASDAGPRTRVRLGPFDTRDEAEAAAGRVKRAGMPANVLVL